MTLTLLLADTSAGFFQLLSQMDAEKMKVIAQNNLWLTLLLCFASGILTSLTPCIYPMIPITINIFGRASQANPSAKGKFNAKTFKLSAIYVGGMCFTYSVMGLLAGLTGSLFGKILQSPWMLLFLAVLFLALALSQFGLFKLQLPSSLQTALSSKGNAQSGFGIFLMGLFSGLIVSPCVGPVIAGILAFVFDTSDAIKGLLYFFSFSLGLGMLFLVIGGFSGMLSALPKSGNWMNRVNRILASLMLIAAGYYGVLFAKQSGLWTNPQNSTAATASKIPWLTDEKAAYEKAKEKNLPIFVDFSAVWCEACHVIDATLFTDPEIEKIIETEYIPLRFDVSVQDEANEAILKKYGVLSLPTLVFVTPTGVISETPRIHGVLSKEEMIKTLKSFLKP